MEMQRSPREPDEAQAQQFAQLLRAGVPQGSAVAYILGDVSGEPDLIAARWLQSRIVVDALATLNGGKWADMDPEARLDVALDKHYAELAHYLYTHDYESAEGKELRKIESAREALQAQRSGRLEANSPFMKFLATLLKPGARPALSDGDGRGLPTRAGTLGLAEVEPVVDAEVTETTEGVESPS